MKNQIFFLFALLPALSFLGCQNITQTAKVSTSAIPVLNESQPYNSARFKIDTTIPTVDIDGTQYTFTYLGRKPATDECNPYAGLIISSKESGKPVFFDTSHAFEGGYKFIKANGASIDKSGPLFLQVLWSGCGSGYACNLFTVKKGDNGINLARVMDYGELSFLKFAQDGNCILQLQGLWNFDEEEGHFEALRYSIILYKQIDKYGWERQEYAATKSKYDGEVGVSEDGAGNDVLARIAENEPGVFNGISDEISDSTILKLLVKR